MVSEEYLSVLLKCHGFRGWWRGHSVSCYSRWQVNEAYQTYEMMREEL